MNTHPLDNLISQYLAEKDITKGSMDLYRTVLKQYTLYLKVHQILYAKTEDIVRYVDWKRSQGYSTQWIYHQISAIKGLYQYLKIHQRHLSLPLQYAQDCSEVIKNESIQRPNPKPVLSIKQARQLILGAQKNRQYIWQYRDYAMLYLMITTGLRSIEIRRAKKSDLRMVHQQLLLYIQGKGRQSSDEFVKISKGVDLAIKEYLVKRQDKNPYLFVSHSHHTKILSLSRTFFRGMLERVLQECGLEDVKITPHALRHTAATLNLQRGGTLESTRRFMRHTSLATTLVYAHHLDQMLEVSQDKLEDYLLGRTA